MITLLLWLEDITIKLLTLLEPLSINFMMVLMGISMGSESGLAEATLSPPMETEIYSKVVGLELILFTLMELEDFLLVLIAEIQHILQQAVKMEISTCTTQQVELTYCNQSFELTQHLQ